jgi:hypothetical protein
MGRVEGVRVKTMAPTVLVNTHRKGSIMDILTVVLAVAATGLVLKMIHEKIADDRDHRRFMENLRRTQARHERDSDKY